MGLRLTFYSNSEFSNDSFLHREAGQVRYETPESPQMPSPIQSQFLSQYSSNPFIVNQYRMELASKGSPQTPYLVKKPFTLPPNEEESNDELELIRGSYESDSIYCLFEQDGLPAFVCQKTNHTQST